MHNHEPNGNQDMRTAILALCLIALSAPSQAAQKRKPQAQDVTREQICRAMIGKGEASARLQQRFRDCMAETLPVVTRP
jgi:hypothetical protein